MDGTTAIIAAGMINIVCHQAGAELVRISPEWGRHMDVAARICRLKTAGMIKAAVQEDKNCICKSARIIK